MAKFKVVLERTETIMKQAEITVEAPTEGGTAADCQDLEVDPGAYDDDLEPIEDGVGEMIVKVENQHEERTQLPRAVAGGRH